ncbi:glycine-rich protein 5 [Drosophila obscura]|uniref:glycine-rich protein 5 n=1 Tax=Drosophila obscura TaxID=7282 RepID=UPI000BA0B55F|nr:glycine-rich protein 5 [Drosophila obscura]
MRFDLQLLLLSICSWTVSAHSLVGGGVGGVAAAGVGGGFVQQPPYIQQVPIVQQVPVVQQIPIVQQPQPQALGLAGGGLIGGGGIGGGVGAAAGFGRYRESYRIRGRGLGGGFRARYDKKIGGGFAGFGAAAGAGAIGGAGGGLLG